LERALSELKGLIIDTPHIENILSGKKIWEMRSTSTKQRGHIALIRKGSGKIIGTAELTETVGPLETDAMLANQSKHLISAERILSGAVAKWKYGWVMKNAKFLDEPVDYRHPSGAVIWVNLGQEETSAVMRQFGR
jgi:hypothetical protein